MTLGQRIALKRKEQGLSQEALGETLGVSRQSVYKWESNSALPEIDKLISMSQLFGVTIGWLLGVEESAAANSDSIKAPPNELSETQLKMVEEIVSRYLAAQQPPKKRRWPRFIAAAMVGIVLLAVLNSLRSELRDMRNQYSSLQSSVNSVTASVDSQISSITTRVEEVLKNQNNLTASYGSEVLSADLDANTVTFSAYAAPKTYTEGMSAVFTADSGEGIAEVPGVLGENHTFSAELTCELTDGITISVIFITGDVRETQLLDTHYALYNRSLPDAPYDFGMADGMMWKELDKNGALDWTGEYEVCRLSSSSSSIYYMDDVQIEQAKLKFFRVGLFQNQKLLGWLEPCEKPEIYRNYEEDECDFYRYPEVSAVPSPEDVFSLAIVMLDEYDREFVFADIGYSLKPDWGELINASTGFYGIDDPANWEY